jgi:hypothetical protein
MATATTTVTEHDFEKWDPENLERLAKLEVEGTHHREALAQLQAGDRANREALERLDADLKATVEELAEVPDGDDGGASGRYEIKLRQIQAERAHETGTYEQTKLAVQIKEHEGLVKANADAIAELKAQLP